MYKKKKEKRGQRRNKIKKRKDNESLNNGAFDIEYRDTFENRMGSIIIDESLEFFCALFLTECNKELFKRNRQFFFKLYYLYLFSRWWTIIEGFKSLDDRGRSSRAP